MANIQTGGEQDKHHPSTYNAVSNSPAGDLTITGVGALTSVEQPLSAMHRMTEQVMTPAHPRFSCRVKPPPTLPHRRLQKAPQQHWDGCNRVLGSKGSSF